ncbi:MAG TPA: DNA-formamidopyrimidine glycosylase family protein [Thermoanaerobaculia bacterium]|nr:DNA-formamidopyrimidine glycosylase family protein [Thermoanaerobaculia bacterium]
MPEGDTIYRVARTLQIALGNRVVTGFDSVLAQLVRVDRNAPIAGRTVEQVTSAGKNLLIHFSGDLILRTHLRMNGSWHVYRPGERWMRRKSDMRIVIATDAWVAVGFSIPVAELLTADELHRHRELSSLGPDLLDAGFDAEEAIRRLRAAPDVEIADALLDQKVMAGIGNVYKSEILFLHRVSPFVRVDALGDDALAALVESAREQMRANVIEADRTRRSMRPTMRRTTRRMEPGAALWVYGRTGRPCRVCGKPIESRRQGKDGRMTYWCPGCQG